ncbi:APC family permease [Halomicrococcus sp. NG-SE-24]|uniref:APC family permease n=1 Tax=Halomicrococcus sp. NG-SE-24 TaxID=3436928 RepID=UPI003D9709AB
MSDDNLDRGLGLPATIAISMGSMIGSGIFILPGVAYLEAGESASVVLAFLLGGILTIPAALSAAELATAIPESGGSYTYIQRGMGPVMGTIAGVGNWMVLNFKTALALIGGLPYLVYLFPRVKEFGLSLGPVDLPAVVVLSVVLIVVFTFVNVASSDGAGQAQNIIVVVMMAVLGLVILVSLPDVARSDPTRVVDIQSGGFLSATSLVFVAYAGVIKVTSVAEEIQNPDRNIPLGIIISLAVTTIVYIAITHIAVVTVDISGLVENAIPVSQGGLKSDGEGAIIAIAAENIIGTPGAILIVAAALLALASTANSGILSASRYPFAMARDGLANREFAIVNSATGTPVVSVLATGGAVVSMVVFLPIDSVARFGAAFQIIVFILVSGAVIGFREANPDEYSPSYLAPAYPYLQLFGVVSGVVLLTLLSTLAFVGTVTITALSIVYYYVFAQLHSSTEGMVKTELREELVDTAENQTRSLLNREGEYRILIALWNPGDVSDRSSEKDDLLDIVSTLDSHGLDLSIDVVEFEQARKATFDEEHPDINADDPPWVEVYEDVSYRHVSTRNIRESIVEYATYNGIDMVAHAFAPNTGRIGFVDGDLGWALENTHCDSVVLTGSSPDTVEKVTLVSNGPTFLPTELLLADALTTAHTAHLEIIHLVAEDASAEHSRAESYLDAVREELISPTTTQIVETADPTTEAARLSRDADIMLTELDISTVWRRLRPVPTVAAGLNGAGPAVFVYSDNPLNYQTIYKRILMKYVFRGLR